MSQSHVSVGEEIMREHGVLERIMLIYEQIMERLIDDDFQHKILGRAARLVDEFIHDYHEEMEERRVFPVFVKDGKHIELVKRLRAQHDTAQAITQELLGMSKLIELENTSTANRLIDLIDGFTGIYRPHSAWEATVLMPELQEMIGDEAYMAMGDEFQAEAQDLFGEDAFHQILGRVEQMEQELEMRTP